MKMGNELSRRHVAKNNVDNALGGLEAAMAGLRVKNAILDGEIVCLDGEGRSLFLELLRRRNRDPPLLSLRSAVA
jgi:ATP-dependent DNA ligase